MCRFSLKFAKTNSKIAEIFEICENYSILFEILHSILFNRVLSRGPTPVLDGGREEGEEPEPRVPPLPVGRQQQLGAHGAELPQRARLHRRRKPGGNDGFGFS